MDASNTDYNRLHDSPPNGRWVRDDWVGHMNDMNDTINKPLAKKLQNDRGCDCCRQVTGAIFFGLLCMPFSCARLLGHYTGWYDPMKVRMCGKERTLPGTECCSASDCSQICCCDERGYGHKDYEKQQEGGNGLSRKTLDKITLCVGAIVPAVFISQAV